MNDARNRAAVLYAPGKIRIEDRPIPTPGAREVLVEVASVGICGSDVHYYEHGRIGSHVVTEPLVLGHETSGRVVDLGPGASRHRTGDRVCIEPGVPCGRCRECRAGHYNLCPEMRFLGTPPVDGSLTNYLAVPEDFAFALPASISDEAGALIEPLAVAVWACGKARISAGDRVLVTGAGPIGLLVAQTARALGATEVVITDVTPARLASASRLGLQDPIDVTRTSLRDTGLQVDALIECSGRGAALQDAISVLRPAGVVVLVGMGEDQISLPLELIQQRELWVTGTFRYAGVYPAAIALAAQGRVDLEAMVTGRFGLDQIDAALRSSRDDAATVKSVVKPGS
jgi:L-iditol 2-dehydrogenase